MKSKWFLIVSIIQVLVGVLGMAAFVVLAMGGEEMTRWILALMIAAIFAVIGIIDIVQWFKK